MLLLFGFHFGVTKCTDFSPDAQEGAKQSVTPASISAVQLAALYGAQPSQFKDIGWGRETRGKREEKKITPSFCFVPLFNS